MTIPTNEAIWLTPAAHAALAAELEQLSRVGAPAPEVDGRVRELKKLLRRSEVEEKPDDGLVEPGMIVTVVFEGDPHPSTFLLARRGVIDPRSDVAIDVYPPESPLGSAIAGSFPGDAFDYVAPSGARVSGRIVSAEPYRSAGVTPDRDG